LANIKRQNFMQGAFIMILSNAIVKVIGAIFKIPLKNLIGGDGMGLFTTAYNVYSALVVISTAGLPVAMSRMIAESNALGKKIEIERILKVAFGVFLTLGVVTMGIMILGAQGFVNAAKNSRALYSVLALSPAVFFVAVMSVYRGYAQGMSNMIPTALSQLIEALCKLFLGYSLAYYCIQKGYGVEIAAAAAIAGVTIGTMLGSLYLIVQKKRSKQVYKTTEVNPDARSSRELLLTLVKIAIPIMIGSAVLSLTNLIDGFIVIRRLQDIDMTEKAANTLYGIYSSMSVSMMTMPQTLIVALTISLIPSISAAYSRRSLDQAISYTSSAMRLTGLIAFPCAAGLYALAGPVLNLLFRSDVEVAAPLLQTLMIAFLFVSMVSVTNAILQAVGKEMLPVISMVAGGIVKIAVNYTLIGIPSIGIAGAPIGTTCCYATIAILCLVFIFTKTPIAPKGMLRLIKTALIAIVTGLCAFLVCSALSVPLGAKLATVAAILVAVFVYIVLLVLCKGLYKEDIIMLPKGDKLVKLLKL